MAAAVCDTCSDALTCSTLTCNSNFFNDANGTQLGPFVENWQRFFVGGEFELRMRGANRVLCGISNDSEGHFSGLPRDVDDIRSVYRFFRRPRVPFLPGR